MWKWFSQLDRILRGETTKPEALREGIQVPVAGLSAVVLLLSALYGVCMGVFAMIRTGGQAWQQMGASAIKVPMLFFLTLLVTFPSLYVFNALMGSRVTVGQAFRLLITSMGVLVATLASLGPIVAFFSVSTTSYGFMVVLNVAACSVAGILGLVFLLRTLHRMVLVQEDQDAPWSPAPQVPPATLPAAREDGAVGPPPPLPSISPFLAQVQHRRRVRSVFYVWCIVFALVGSQMGWVLRPFIGDPNRPFEFFRARESNFFEAVANALKTLLGG